MALVSNIVIDLALSTATLTTTVSSNVVETISYSANQVTFALRPDIIINKVDFLGLIAQFNVFQTALYANFSNSLDIIGSFNAANNSEAHDSVLNQWNLLAIYGASPRVCNYSASLATHTVELFSRASAKTIFFSEWIYFLAALNHYRDSVNRYI